MNKLSTGAQNFVVAVVILIGTCAFTLVTHQEQAANEATCECSEE